MGSTIAPFSYITSAQGLQSACYFDVLRKILFAYFIKFLSFNYLIDYYKF